VVRALALARDSDGKSIAAKMEMMAMTTSSSISVKAPRANHLGREMETEPSFLFMLDFPKTERERQEAAASESGPQPITKQAVLPVGNSHKIM